MKFPVAIIAIVAASLTIASTDRCSGQPLRTAKPPVKATFEYENFDAAWKAAQKSDQPLLVFVTSSHCHFCVKMERKTLAHPVLAPVFARVFETVAVHADDDPELTKKLGVRMFPTTLVISPQGKLLGRLDGYVAPQAIGAQINPVLKKYYAARTATQVADSR